MVPGAGRTGLNSSSLIRLLADTAALETGASKASMAERLGDWLGWTDAIALSAVLNAGPAAADPAPTPRRPTGHDPLHTATQACARVRTELARAITSDPVFASSAAADDGNDADAFGPYRRGHGAHQRTMAMRIAALRADVRAVLAASSPRLGRLAALDAVMEAALGERERSLLASVPSWLERHFRQLRQAPERAEALAGFGSFMHSVLLAELDLRLQPVQGLMAALGPAAPEGPMHRRSP